MFCNGKCQRDLPAESFARDSRRRRHVPEEDQEHAVLGSATLGSISREMQVGYNNESERNPGNRRLLRIRLSQIGVGRPGSHQDLLLLLVPDRPGRAKDAPDGYKKFGRPDSGQTLGFPGFVAVLQRRLPRAALGRHQATGGGS